jgi:hypothetical protein
MFLQLKRYISRILVVGIKSELATENYQLLLWLCFLQAIEQPAGMF